MTSAVLNSNEPTLMGNSSITNPNPNPNPKMQRQNYLKGSVVMEPVAMTQQSVADHTPSRSSPFDQVKYQTFNVGSYTHSEKKELKKRLRIELQQVREVNSQIEKVEKNQVWNQKKLSGRKRPTENMHGEWVKRMAVESSKVMKKCGQVLTKLMKHKLGWIFNVPVDVVGMKLHDYYTIVKKPMDLGSIKENLSRNVYVSPMDFAADVRLTFNNAMLYNPKGHDVYIMAEKLLAMFDCMFRPISEEYEFELQRFRQMSYQNFYSAELPESVWVNNEASRMPDRLAAQDVEVSEFVREHELPQVIGKPAVVDVSMPAPLEVQTQGAASLRTVSQIKPLSKTKLPKPKAKDPNKRGMTNVEKSQLGTELQSLPEEKMIQMLQILQKRNHQVVEDEDELELDIESLDTEILWELDRFVINWKKSLSKQRRQGLTGNNSSLPSDGDDMTVSDAEVNTAAHGEDGKAKKGDEEDIDIGDEMPVSSFPPVEIEKDDAQDNVNKHSSSSGSSSSDSSSSDSGSSSGSESDAEVD